ncbi:hypothetical protein GCM10007079_41450 [Nocardiopsis terrae]|uniref:hypothetical protein n=1 Tax=Nocardiopsis terrae TaxID=372655 RepID=UPI0017496092|nr:hypothetical protein [Nocardiopsis terrae]GHC92801.1 hypothetical protein GCM10007079_41450 [Nocardiopsis terrae]
MQRVNILRNSLRNPRNLRIPAVTAVAALVPCLFFGSTAFLAWLGARAAWLTLPTSLGVPFAFPRLSLAAVVGQPGWSLATELAAVLVLAAVAAWWTRRALELRPGANPWRVLLSAWVGVLLGLVLANALRAGLTALAAGAGALPFLAYAFAGALSGLLWAVCLGWVCAAPAALVHRFTDRARGVGEPAPT